MSTAYTFDTTLSLSFKPRTAESSHRDLTTVAKIVAVSAAVVTVVAALLSVHTEVPGANVRGCAYVANHHVSRLSVERDWRTHGLPILIAPGNCSRN